MPTLTYRLAHVRDRLAAKAERLRTLADVPYGIYAWQRRALSERAEDAEQVAEELGRLIQDEAARELLHMWAVPSALGRTEP